MSLLLKILAILGIIVLSIWLLDSVLVIVSTVIIIIRAIKDFKE